MDQFEYNGVTDHLAGHCRRLGISYDSVKGKKRRCDLSGPDALDFGLKPRTKPGVFDFDGVSASLYKHCQRLGIKYFNVWNKYYRANGQLTYTDALQYELNRRMTNG